MVVDGDVLPREDDFDGVDTYRGRVYDVEAVQEDQSRSPFNEIKTILEAAIRRALDEGWATLKVDGLWPSEYIFNRARHAGLSKNETEALWAIYDDYKMRKAGSGAIKFASGGYSQKPYAGYGAAERASGAYLEDRDAS